MFADRSPSQLNLKSVPERLPVEELELLTPEVMGKMLHETIAETVSTQHLDLPYINLLLFHGACSNYRTKEGHGALESAIALERIDLIELLLQKGARVRPRDLDTARDTSIINLVDMLQQFEQLLSLIEFRLFGYNWSRTQTEVLDSSCLCTTCMLRRLPASVQL